MANTKKLIQAAAGAAGGAAALNVEDVFSTYLYEGTGGSQSIENGIALGDFGLGTSTKFDGTNDYLSLSSDLTGNADGKTFTFSAWAYLDKNILADNFVYGVSNGTTNSAIVSFTTASGSEGRVNGNFYNASGTRILQISASTGYIPNNTWAHVLISVDLANTANRYIYVNDVEATSVSWSTYTNDNINFTNSQHVVGAARSAVAPFDGRLAHVYLDYTYRDLSVEANRRLFIDANGGSTAPSTLSALSPILYLPMTEDYSIGENLGTGGDFTANGSPTIIQSGTEYEDGYGEGGMVWIKTRDAANAHSLTDTERGRLKILKSNTTDAEVTANDSFHINSFNSNGFTLGQTWINGTNSTNNNNVSWTFRKAPKFFDVVTYTGNGSTQTISHNLGSVPGCIIVKRTDSTSNWAVYHRGNTAQPETEILYLNLTNATSDVVTWNDTAPTSTDFQVFGFAANSSGGTYVAYLFAHNDGDGEFGPTGDQDIIKCGSYTGGGSTNVSIDLGFEPQWIMIKAASGTTGVWTMFDNMRGIATGGTDNLLRANATNAEYTSVDYIDVTSTGFKTIANNNYTNGSGNTYIYMAIRRPTAVPESATDVFAPVDDLATGNRSSGFTTDAYLLKRTDNTNDWRFWSRLTDENMLSTNSTAAQTSYSGVLDWDQMDGVTCLLENTPNINYFWKRAPNYFDVVAYTGTGSATTINHNLGVAPEMMWVKKRSSTGNWIVYHSGIDVNSDGAPETDYILLDSTAAAGDSAGFWNDTAPTASNFSLGSSSAVNQTSQTHIAYLFASLDGVSKVGSYTGNGSSDGDTQDIDCGFASGARFVLIKRTSSTGNWMLYDTERGIVSSGDDKRLELNGTGAEDTNENCIEPLSSGFTVRWDIDSSASNNPNISGSTYIFYAIA